MNPSISLLLVVALQLVLLLAPQQAALAPSPRPDLEPAAATAAAGAETSTDTGENLEPETATVTLDKPFLVGSRNATEGNFWFPCCLSNIDDVAVLRVNVVPDATYNHTPAAVYSSVDDGHSFQSQTPRACAQFDEPSCVLPGAGATDQDATGQDGPAPARQWTMMIPQPDQQGVVLGIASQARVFGGWNRRGLEWTGQKLHVQPDGRVLGVGGAVNITLTGLTRDIALILEKNTVWNYTKVSAVDDHLAVGVFAVGDKALYMKKFSLK